MEPNPERRRYERIAPMYDLMEAIPERTRMGPWRRILLERSPAGLALELGVGTGQNLAYHHEDTTLVAVDISEKMLRRARAKASGAREVHFAVMNAESLGFPDGVFPSAVVTFVFCSVSDPVKGLRELRRVLRTDGRAFFLEHVRPDSRVLGRVFDWLNLLTVRITGANINRDTVDNIRRAGFTVEEELNLWRDIVKLIVARRVETARGE